MPTDAQPTGRLRWFEVEPGEWELQQLWRGPETDELNWLAVPAFDARGETASSPRFGEPSSRGRR